MFRVEKKEEEDLIVHSDKGIRLSLYELPESSSDSLVSGSGPILGYVALFRFLLGQVFG